MEILEIREWIAFWEPVFWAGVLGAVLGGFLGEKLGVCGLLFGILLGGVGGLLIGLYFARKRLHRKSDQQITDPEQTERNELE